MKGTPEIFARRAQSIVSSLQSSIVTAPASAARRKLGARPKPSKLTIAVDRRRTQPAANSQSTFIPPLITIRSRSRRPALISSRQKLSGAPPIISPPIATRGPVGNEVRGLLQGD